MSFLYQKQVPEDSGLTWNLLVEHEEAILQSIYKAMAYTTAGLIFNNAAKANVPLGYLYVTKELAMIRLKTL